jgi:hypothetical protein
MSSHGGGGMTGTCLIGENFESDFGICLYVRIEEMGQRFKGDDIVVLAIWSIMKLKKKIMEIHKFNFSAQSFVYWLFRVGSRFENSMFL